MKHEIKRQAMSAVANVTHIASQAGLAVVAAGAAVYAAHIRQMDRQRMAAAPQPRQVRRDAIGREV